MSQFASNSTKRKPVSKGWVDFSSSINPTFTSSSESPSSLRTFFLHTETWHHIYRISDHRYILILEPGKISMNVSTITQEESYRVKTKLKKWDWVWQLGITNISKNNQIYSAPSESSDWSLTCWQYLQSAKISTSTNPIAIENSPKN